LIISEEPKECKDKKATECTIDIDSCDDNNRRDNNDEIQEIASNSESEAEKELNKNKTNKRTTRRVNNRASVIKRRKV